MPKISPNILFIFDDQHRYSALGASGNQVIHTPNLDDLAAQGITLEHSFSSCPICAPYRGQIMSGRYSHKNGVLDNEYRLRKDQMTLAESLRGAGYYTGFIGKWHLGYPPYPENERYGFDYMAAHNAIHHYYEIEYFENERGPIKIEGWAPEEETTLAIRFLEEHCKDHADSPFFLMLGWGPPHTPLTQYPQKYNIYDPAHVDILPNVPKQLEAYARQEIAQYYGNITALDAQMGRLMEALTRLGLVEETVVIFTSDHGDHLSSHGHGRPNDDWLHYTKRADKATPYDESSRVPFIARWPNHISAGARSKALFSSVDVMPTLLGFGHAEIPETVQGMDLSHVLLGKEGPLRDSVYLQILGPGWPGREKWIGFWRGVRTDEWLYTRWKDDECEPLLIDCVKDPYQMNNLANHPEYRAVRQNLEERLRQWIAETDDPFETGSRDPDTGMLLLGQEYIDAKLYDRDSQRLKIN